jgi:branched-chain amino acid transport system permease protein
MMLVLGIALYVALFFWVVKFDEGHRIKNSLLIGFGLTVLAQGLAVRYFDPLDFDTSITTSYSTDSWQFLGLRLPLVRFSGLVIGTLVVIGLQIFLRRTYWGKAIRATAEDWQTASLAGINVHKMYLITLSLGAVLAGLAGMLVMLQYSVSPSIGLNWTLKALIVVVLAGLGNMSGTFAAGIILGLAEAASALIFGSEYREMVGLAMFLVILSVRPQGLFGEQSTAGEYKSWQDRVTRWITDIRNAVPVRYIMPAVRSIVSAPAQVLNKFSIKTPSNWLKLLLSWIHQTLVDWRLALILLMAGGLAYIPETSYGSKNNLTLLITLFTIASLASSWNILAGFVGQVNLGHVVFFGLGSLVTRQLWLVEGKSFELAFLAGGGAAALAALLIGVPALRLKGIYFSVGTLALAEAMRLTVGSRYPKISRLPGPVLRAYEIEPRYYLSLGVLMAIVLIVYFLRRSRLGLGMMAVRDDEEAARSIGINVFLHTLFAFVLSAFLAGLVGGTFAYFQSAYYHSLAFRPTWTFDALLVTFVGGIGTLTGPLLGAAFFVLVRDELAANLVNFHLIIFGIIFILVVLILPGGLVDLSTRLSRLIQRAKAVLTVEENEPGESATRIGRWLGRSKSAL